MRYLKIFVNLCTLFVGVQVLETTTPEGMEPELCPMIDMGDFYNFNPKVFSGRWYIVSGNNVHLNRKENIDYCSYIDFEMSEEGNVVTSYNVQTISDKQGTSSSFVHHWKAPNGWHIPFFFDRLDKQHEMDIWMLGTDGISWMTMYGCEDGYSGRVLAKMSGSILSRYNSVGDFAYKQALYSFEKNNVSTAKFKRYDQTSCGYPKRIPSQVMQNELDNAEERYQQPDSDANNSGNTRTMGLSCGGIFVATAALSLVSVFFKIVYV